MGSFKDWYRYTSLFLHILIVINAIAASNARGLQAGSLLVNGTRSTHNSIHSIQTHVYILIHFMMQNRNLLKLL